MTTTTKEALEPCPFCGVVPTMQHHTQEEEMDDGRYLFFVECASGKCPMALVSTGGPFKSAKDAAAKWNSRVSAPIVAPVVDENSAVFTAYNQAIEDAKAAIRLESQGGGYWAAAYINAIARRCSPHVYVNRLAPASTVAPQLHWPFAAKHDNCAECEKEYEPPPAPASPAALRDEADRPRHIGSSRHPHFTHADHERMKQTLDALSDNPTDEEAEAVLQACGTSGKEVVNEFIERLLKENLELKTKLESATTPPSTLAKAAAEIVRYFRDLASYGDIREPDESLLITKVLEMLSGTASGEICKSHGLAVLVTHVNDGEPCSDYLHAAIIERCFSAESES